MAEAPGGNLGPVTTHEKMSRHSFPHHLIPLSISPLLLQHTPFSLSPASDTQGTAFSVSWENSAERWVGGLREIVEICTEMAVCFVCDLTEGLLRSWAELVGSQSEQWWGRWWHLGWTALCPVGQYAPSLVSMERKKRLSTICYQLCFHPRICMQILTYRIGNAWWKRQIHFSKCAKTKFAGLREADKFQFNEMKRSKDDCQMKNVQWTE